MTYRNTPTPAVKRGGEIDRTGQPLEVALLEAEERPVYQRIAEEAAHLRRLGMKSAKIARRFGVDAKTVKKAADWSG